MPTRRPAPTYLTASQVAALFHVSAKTVGRWAREGKLPYTATLGGHRRYGADDMRAIRDAQDAQAEGAGQ